MIIKIDKGMGYNHPYDRAEITHCRAEEALLRSIQKKWGDLEQIEEVKDLMWQLKGLVGMRRPWIKEMHGIEETMMLFNYSFNNLWESKEVLGKTLLELYPFLTAVDVYWNDLENTQNQTKNDASFVRSDNTSLGEWGRLNNHVR